MASHVVCSNDAADQHFSKYEKRSLKDGKANSIGLKNGESPLCKGQL
jgi:hypothetical protein